jgi:hypothetical protein
LDWILDWDALVFRVPPEALGSNRAFGGCLSNLLEIPALEIEQRRRSIFAAYWLFLAPERMTLFEALVWFRVKELLNANLPAN